MFKTDTCYWYMSDWLTLSAASSHLKSMFILFQQIIHFFLQQFFSVSCPVKLMFLMKRTEFHRIIYQTNLRMYGPVQLNTIFNLKSHKRPVDKHFKTFYKQIRICWEIFVLDSHKCSHVELSLKSLGPALVITNFSAIDYNGNHLWFFTNPLHCWTPQSTCCSRNMSHEFLRPCIFLSLRMYSYSIRMYIVTLCILLYE